MYKFLFMEYVNLTKVINNIRKTELKEENKIDSWKYEGRNLQKNEPNSEIRTKLH